MMFGANATSMSLVAVAVLEALWVQEVGAFGFSTKGRSESVTSTSTSSFRSTWQY